MTATVRDVMMPEPWTIEARTSLDDTARQMRAWDVDEALITDHGKLCGQLSNRDIIVTAIASERDPSAVTAGECANPDTPRLPVDQSVEEAFAYMRRLDLRRLPVVDGDQLMGTAWIADVAQAAARHTNT